MQWRCLCDVVDAVIVCVCSQSKELMLPESLPSTHGVGTDDSAVVRAGRASRGVLSSRACACCFNSRHLCVVRPPPAAASFAAPVGSAYSSIGTGGVAPASSHPSGEGARPCSSCVGASARVCLLSGGVPCGGCCTTVGRPSKADVAASDTFVWYVPVVPGIC